MAATLDARLRLNSADFTSGLNRAMRESNVAVSKMSATFSNLRNVFTGGVGGLFLGSSIQSIMDARIEVEKLGAAMKATMGGSSALGQQTMKEINDLANQIGLSVSSTAKAFIQLKSSGMATADAMKLIRGGFNAVLSTGGGEAEFSRLAIALQQMRNSAKPLQEEINQMREALPTTSRFMQEAFGAQRAEDLQKLGVSGREVVDALNEIMATLPKVGDTLGKQVNTLGSVWTQFKATLGDSLLGDLYQGGLSVAKDVLETGAFMKQELNDLVAKLLGVYDPNESARIKAAAAAAAAAIDAQITQDTESPGGGLTEQEVEDWKKANEAWKQARKEARQQAADDDNERAYQDASLQDALNRSLDETRAKVSSIAEEWRDVRKQQQEANQEAQAAAMQGLADAKDAAQNMFNDEFNRRTQEKMKSREQRREDRDEKRRLKRAQESARRDMENEALKKARDEFKKNEFDNNKNGKFWDERAERKRIRKDTQEAAKKAAEGSLQKLTDILAVLKTLATA